MTGDAAAETRGRRLLLLGAVAGIALTAHGLLGTAERAPARADAVAVVNGQPLSREAFDRFVAAVAQERKSAALPVAERQRILDRLIDEELLLQYGIGLGLARHEPTARRVIVQSVIASVTGAAEDATPSDDDLRDYFARNPDRFARSGRVSVEAARVRVTPESDDAAARARAVEVTRRMGEGADLEALRAELPDVELPPVPGGPVPLETVRRYLGPTAALRARDLEPGTASEPIRTGAGYVVLRVLARTEPEVPPFETVAAQVRAEWVREQGERALRNFLDDLRAGADLEVTPLGEEAGAAPGADAAGGP